MATGIARRSSACRTVNFACGRPPRGTGSPGRGGGSTLRKEIGYLTSLRAEAAELFPRVLSAWDSGDALGYEMSYVPDSADVAELARGRKLMQAQADAFQDALSHAVFGLLHVETRAVESLAEGIRQTLTLALNQLGDTPEFAALINAERVSINGLGLLAGRAAAEEVFVLGDTLREFEGPLCIRLHGDLFLENIVLPREETGPDWPRQLTLLAPVSVAGTWAGHPLFDLVKYESYATGELPAMRSEKVRVEGAGGGGGGPVRLRSPLGRSGDQPVLRHPLARAIPVRVRREVRPGRREAVCDPRGLLRRGDGRVHRRAAPPGPRVEDGALAQRGAGARLTGATRSVRGRPGCTPGSSPRTCRRCRTLPRSR